MKESWVVFSLFAGTRRDARSLLNSGRWELNVCDGLAEFQANTLDRPLPLVGCEENIHLTIV